MILDGTSMGLSLFGETLDPRSHLIRFYPDLAVPPLDRVVLTAAPLVARINHGVWIASCPCGMTGAPTPGGVVFLDRPLVWCLRCQNGATGRGWRRVAVPDPVVRSQIEAVLLCRPRVEDRNWEPSETVADLIAQNRDRGDPVPDFGPHMDWTGPDGAVATPDADWRELVRPFSSLVRQARSRLSRLLRR